MRDYVLRRLLLVPLTFVGITFVAFCFTRFVPGGPIEQAMAERQQAENRKQTSAARPSGPASPEELDNLRRRSGFDRPLLQAYAVWLGALPGPADWVTVRLDKDGKAEAEVADDQAAGSPLKLIVRAENGEAIYFSRSPIPHLRGVDPAEWVTRRDYWAHIGVYGYDRATLAGYAQLKATELEAVESLEQLRFLAHGLTFQTVVTDYHPVAIDTAEDLEAARRLLA